MARSLRMLPTERPPRALTDLADELPEPRETIVAVFSGFERSGEWLPPEQLRVFALFGGGKLDLRQAIFAPGVTEIRIFAMFGGVEIKVPRDVDLELRANAFLGGVTRSEVEPELGGRLRRKLQELVTGTSMPPPQPYDPDDDDRPIVRVTGFAMFGGVGVKVG